MNEHPGTAWEDPAVGFPTNFVSSWWESLTQPTTFFDGLRWDEMVSRPLLYFLVATVGSAVFSLGWRLAGIGGALSDSLLESTAEMVGESGGLAAELLAATAERTRADLLLDFFLEPFIQLIALFVTVIVVHLFVAMMAQNRRGMSATLRVASYAAGPSLLTIFPFIGATVGWVWSVVLLILGVSVAHRTSTGRAAAIVLLPLFLAITLISVLTVLLILFAAAMISVPG